MDRRFFTIGSVAGALAVVLGAFGAHSIRHRLTPEMLDVFETAVRYQLLHALALLAAAWAAQRWPGRSSSAAGWLFLAGIALFSGSLYVISLTGVRALGLLTPFGGGAFIAAWLLLAITPWKRSRGPT